MAVTYKDINLLTQKSSVAGTEKFPVSDTQYLTTAQIATSKQVHLADESDMPASPDASTLYLIDDDGSGGGGGSYTLPIASASTLGGIKVGTGLSINSTTGVLTATGGGSYTLPTASSSTLGGVKVGDGLSINSSTGVLATISKIVYLTDESQMPASPDANTLYAINGTGGGGGGGDTSDCVHKTGDESVGGDKTFTDNIEVVDASHILYSGASPSQGFTRDVADVYMDDTAHSLDFPVEGEPKAFILTCENVPFNYDTFGVLMVVGDSTGLHGIYNTGSQHNYSTGFTKSYSNGTLTITAPNGVDFGDVGYNLIYYYGDGTLTFKTSQVQPGSGVTAVTFTGNGLTEVPAMYAVMLETQVNDEQYRRVAGYTNCAYSSFQSAVVSEGITFLTGGPVDTTSSFSASYNNGLVINSGGTNAGGYFHNPGTYTLYYLMASDIGGGGSGSYSSLADELAAINTTIGDIATILASI